MSLEELFKDHREVLRQKRFLAAHAAGHDRIYRYFRRRTYSPATAEDLCAEVFRIAWEKTLDRDDLSVMFLFGMAKNVLRNHHRATTRSTDLITALRSEHQSHETSGHSPLLEALEHLPIDDQEILLLTYWDGLSSKEISGVLGTSATAVRMRLHRARKTLGNLLGSNHLVEGAEA